jgi:hypothetical protein
MQDVTRRFHPLRPGSLALAIVAALGSTACLTEDVDPDVDPEVAPDLEAPGERLATTPEDGEPVRGAALGDGPTEPPVAAAYSSWIYLQGSNCAVYLRYCKTSTRINWQFTANTRFDHVSTYGDGMSYLTSNIDGVASGSKYRTRAGTTMTWVFDDRDTGCGTISWGTFLSLIPSC